MLVNGTGTLEKNRLTADTSSSDGEVSSALTGHLKDAEWQGNFSMLDLESPYFGRWRLKDKPSIRIAKKTKGFEVTASKACLIRQDAALCREGRYFANEDFEFNVKAVSLPMSVMQKYLPEPVKVNSMIDAEAAVERQKGLFAGTFRIDVPANASVVFKNKEAATKISLRESNLTGSVNGEIITADLSLSLGGQDYLRAQLRLVAGATRTLSGQVTASVTEFALLNPFAPQLSNIKANLKGDLALTGNIDKPAVKEPLISCRVPPT